MGEYLKTLMIKKMNDPDFKIPYIPKTKPIKKRFMGLRKNIRKRPNHYIPPELRRQDLSHLRVKLPEEMGRQEFEKWQNLVQMNQENVDLSTDHPLIKVFL